MINNLDYNGNNLLTEFQTKTSKECEDACSTNDLCLTYSYKNNSCFLKFRYKYAPTAVNDPSALSAYPMIGINLNLINLNQN